MGFAADVGAEIVGEGIESAGQAAALRDLGVRYGQGYFLGPPRPACAQLEPGRRLVLLGS